MLSAYFFDYFFESYVYSINQYRTPILKAPNNMVLAGINYVVICFVFHGM